MQLHHKVLEHGTNAYFIVCCMNVELCLYQLAIVRLMLCDRLLWLIGCCIYIQEHKNVNRINEVLPGYKQESSTLLFPLTCHWLEQITFTWLLSWVRKCFPFKMGVKKRGVEEVKKCRKALTTHTHTHTQRLIKLLSALTFLKIQKFISFFFLQFGQ